MKLQIVTFNPSRERVTRFTGKVGIHRELGRIEVTVAPSRVRQIRKWFRTSLRGTAPDENWHVARVTAEVTHHKDTLGNARLHRVTHLGVPVNHIDKVVVRRNPKRGTWR